MPQGQMNTESDDVGEVKYPELFELFDQIKRDYLRVHRRKFPANVKILPYLTWDGRPVFNSTSLSQTFNGMKHASPTQLLVLARYFGIHVEVLLRAGGFPDLAALQQAVEKDTKARDPKERADIIAALKLAQLDTLPHPYEHRTPWRQLDWVRSIYKEQGDEVLASSLSPYEKAKRFADVVIAWWENPQGDSATRAMRRTDEILSLVS